MSTPFKRRNNMRVLVVIIFICSVIAILLFGTSILRIKTMTVEGSEYYSDEKIMAKAGVSLGMHFLQINKKRSIKQVSALPYVELVEMETIFPNTLKLKITQRKPIGYVPFQEHIFQLIKQGK